MLAGLYLERENISYIIDMTFTCNYLRIDLKEKRDKSEIGFGVERQIRTKHKHISESPKYRTIRYGSVV